MITSRHPAIRLFPVDNNYVAVSTVLKDAANENSLHLSISTAAPSLNSAARSVSHHSNLAPFVLDKRSKSLS